MRKLRQGWRGRRRAAKRGGLKSAHYRAQRVESSRLFVEKPGAVDLKRLKSIEHWMRERRNRCGLGTARPRARHASRPRIEIGECREGEVPRAFALFIGRARERVLEVR